MLKEKIEGKKQPGLTVKNDAGSRGITPLIFDIANFNFSLKDLPGSIKRIKNIIKKHTGATGCTIMFLDNYGYLWKVGEETTYPFKVGEGVAGWSAKCKKIVSIKDIRKDKRYKPLYGAKLGSIVSVPVMKNGRVIGVLNLTFAESDDNFIPPDKAVLNILAKKMESILENVFLYYVAEGERNELKIRKSISIILEDKTSLRKKVSAIRNKLSRLVKVQHLHICIEDKPKKVLLCAIPKEKHKRILNKDLIKIYLDEKGKKHDFLDLSEIFNFDFASTNGSGYTTIYPIFSKGKMVGYILLEDEVKNTDNLSALEKRFIDITSKKLGNYLAEQTSSEKMLAEKERWRTIFHNVDDGILLLSRGGTVMEANLKARELLGVNDQSGLADKSFFSLFDILNPEVESPTIASIKKLNKFKRTDSKELSKKIDLFFTSSKAFRPKEYYIKTKSGKYWVTIGMKTALQNRQSEIYGIIHLRDITKTKEVEQDKNEFMSMVSHELRTPLSAMKGYLSMALNEDYGKLNKKQRKSLGRIKESSERMVSLVEDILDVSRIELGKFDLYKEPINFSKITCAVLRELGAKIQAKKISITVQGKKIDCCLNAEQNSGIKHQCQNLNIYVLADRDRIMQILTNLIDNAIKYSFDGGKINIKFASSRNFAEISIKDNGVGVAKEDQDRLFMRFSRIHNPLSIQAGGTGLGLYITKKLVIAHDGKISVSSMQGKGTTFSVKIPVAKQLPLI